MIMVLSTMEIILKADESPLKLYDLIISIWINIKLLQIDIYKDHEKKELSSDGKKIPRMIAHMQKNESQNILGFNGFNLLVFPLGVNFFKTQNPKNLQDKKELLNEIVSEDKNYTFIHKTFWNLSNLTLPFFDQYFKERLKQLLEKD